GQAPLFSWDFFVLAPRSLIVFPAQYGAIGFVSAFAEFSLSRCSRWLSPYFFRSDAAMRPCRPWFGPGFGVTLHGDSGPENNHPRGPRIVEGPRNTLFFPAPEQPSPRQYEALRAVFVEGQPLEPVAVRFGYKVSTLQSMVSRFRAERRCGATPPFFARTAADGPAGHRRAEAAPLRKSRRSPTSGGWTSPPAVRSAP